VNPIVLAPTSLSNAEPLEFIDAAAKAGYDGVGLRLYRSPGITYAFHPVAGNPQLVKDVKKALDDGGLKVYDVLSFYLQPEMDFDSMQAPLECAVEIGADYALVIGDDPDWNRMVSNFGKFCEMAGKLNLIASIEAPVTQRVVNTLPKALGLIHESGAKNAVICLDPYHFMNVGHTPEMLKNEDMALFPYTQIDDGVNTVPAPGGRTAIGEGMVPLDEMFDILPQELPLSLEYGPGRGSSYTAAEWAKIAYDSAKNFMVGYYERRKAKA
jgi:sugar phosphate isomerase/epimerase